MLRCIALFAVIGLALGALAAEWGVSIHDMSRSRGAIGGLLARALDITVVVLIADLVWLWAKTAIDRRVAALAPRPPKGLPGEVSDSGTRLATLLPLLRKAVFVVIVTAATLISLSSLGVDIAPLLAGAGVAGIAIGFGAQTLVRDIVSGIFCSRTPSALANMSSSGRSAARWRAFRRAFCGCAIIAARSTRFRSARSAG